ncbi:MAG: hypothetical protein U0736_00775 [Gemmataceae bacterium]
MVPCRSRSRKQATTPGGLPVSSFQPVPGSSAASATASSSREPAKRRFIRRRQRSDRGRSADRPAPPTPAG